MPNKIEFDEDPALKGAPAQDTLFPDVDNSDPDPKKDADENTVKIEALEKEIAAGKERDLKSQETIANLSKLPPQAQPAVSPPPGDTPPVEAPDPITDPEGYKNHIKAEITGEVKTEINNLRADTAKEKVYNEIWGDFARENKELALNHIDLVKYQATELLREIAGQGVDPQQYLITNKGVFMKDVADRTNNMISKIRGEALDTGRTDGVLSSSPRTVTQKKTDEPIDKASSFVKELQDAQMKTGFF